MNLKINYELRRSELNFKDQLLFLTYLIRLIKSFSLLIRDVLKSGEIFENLGHSVTRLKSDSNPASQIFLGVSAVLLRRWLSLLPDDESIVDISEHV